MHARRRNPADRPELKAKDGDNSNSDNYDDHQIDLEHDDSESERNYDGLINVTAGNVVESGAQMGTRYDNGRGHNTKAKELSFVVWNIEGLLPKLEFGDFISYLEQYAIIGLVETWMTDADKLRGILPNYKSHFCPAKPSEVWGRSMSGIAVFCRKEQSPHVKRMYTDCDSCIFLLFSKQLLKQEKDLLYICTYIPPNDSPSYKNKSYKGIELLEEELTNVDYNIQSVNILLAGDFNARIAEVNEFVNETSNIPELEEFNDVLNSDIDTPRKSQDKTVNRFGRELINLCKSYALYIINGRYGVDKNIGDYVCSVIDYFIASKNVFDFVNSFEVATPAESKHFPLCLVLNLEWSRIHVDNERDNIYYRYNTRSSDEIKQTLREAIDTDCFTQLENDAGNIEININDIMTRFMKIVYTSIGSCKHNT